VLGARRRRAEARNAARAAVAAPIRRPPADACDAGQRAAGPSASAAVRALRRREAQHRSPSNSISIEPGEKP
ncbi:hypothetical protein ACX84Q_34195, partial [Burkholderia pseudomallei]